MSAHYDCNLTEGPTSPDSEAPLRRIVVDASVVLAGLFKDGTVRDILINIDDAELIAPQYLRSEVERHLAEAAFRSNLPEVTVRAVFEDLLAAVELVPPEVYSGSMDRAAEVARRAGARGDEDYIALALTFDATVWTLDLDFVRTAGVSVLRTKDVEAPWWRSRADRRS